jgi:hypothetical protein
MMRVPARNEPGGQRAKERSMSSDSIALTLALLVILILVMDRRQ